MDSPTVTTKPDPRKTIQLFNDASDAVADARAFAFAVNMMVEQSRDERSQAIMACITQVLTALSLAAETVEIGSDEIREGTRQ